jgi:hypothetical protein
MQDSNGQNRRRLEGPLIGAFLLCERRKKLAIGVSVWAQGRSENVGARMTAKGQTRTVAATGANVRFSAKRTFIVWCGYDRESPNSDINLSREASLGGCVPRHFGGTHEQTKTNAYPARRPRCRRVRTRSLATRKCVGTLRATTRLHPVHQSGNRYENLRHTCSFIVVHGRIRGQR